MVHKQKGTRLVIPNNKAMLQLWRGVGVAWNLGNRDLTRQNTLESAIECAWQLGCCLVVNRAKCKLVKHETLDIPLQALA